MRFSFILIIVATLIASVSASDAATEHCPIFCIHDRHCSSGVVLDIHWDVPEVLNNVFASESRTSNGDLGRVEICGVFRCHRA
ncbi:hypothetical protein DFJ58DRAFT_804708, partial [Suillus subalutaceus]|uniref:uncharacterized protein n=1 Tax=Suillus subalutaceus TaxID=48586 RepID=UPI001B874565